nr:MAG TPA: hypothetical protein [Crassvirales sp.]
MSICYPKGFLSPSSIASCIVAIVQHTFSSLYK